MGNGQWETVIRYGTAPVYMPYVNTIEKLSVKISFAFSPLFFQQMLHDGTRLGCTVFEPQPQTTQQLTWDHR